MLYSTFYCTPTTHMHVPNLAERPITFLGHLAMHAHVYRVCRILATTVETMLYSLISYFLVQLMLMDETTNTHLVACHCWAIPYGLESSCCRRSTGVNGVHVDWPGTTDHKPVPNRVAHNLAHTNTSS